MNRRPATPMSRILGTGRCVPSTVVSNAELSPKLSINDTWIRKHTGIERRHIANARESTSDLAAIAGRAALESAKLTPADLDMIILATVSGDSPMPATAAIVQQKLGADLIPSFDISASFAGFLYALAVADQFIAAGTHQTVLVVGADMLSRHVNPEDRATAPLFGDGAGAVVLGQAQGDGRGILACNIHADGSMADMLSIPGGGSAEPHSKESLEKKHQFIHLDGHALFQESVKHLSSYSLQALKSAGLTSAELDWVVPQQANKNIVDKIAHRFGFPRSKFIENIAEYGNTSAASIPITLDEALRDRRIKPGQNVLLCALGAGLTWGASIIRM